MGGKEESKRGKSVPQIENKIFRDLVKGREDKGLEKQFCELGR